MASTLIVLLSGTLPGISQAQMYYPDSIDIRPLQESSTGWLIQYLKPGQVKEELIKISNLSNQEKKISLSVNDAEIGEKNSFTLTHDETHPDRLSTWVQLLESNREETSDTTETSLTLAAGESRTLSVRFKVPESLKPGLYPGAVMAREVIDNNGTSMVMEKGVRLYANVMALTTTTSAYVVLGLVLLLVGVGVGVIAHQKKLTHGKYAAIGLVLFGFPLLLSELPDKDLKAQVVVDETPHFYTVTVEWSRREGLLVPDYYTKTWDGIIKASNAKIDHAYEEDFEGEDKVTLLNDNTILRFHTISAVDTDRVVMNLWLENPHDSTVLQYIPDQGGIFEFVAGDLINNPTTYTDGLFSVRFSAEVPLAEQDRIRALKEAAELLLKQQEEQAAVNEAGVSDSSDTSAEQSSDVIDSESSDTQPSDSADSTSTDSASDPSAEASDSSDTSPDPTATPDDTTPDDPTTDPESPSDPSQEADAGDTQPDTTETPSDSTVRDDTSSPDSSDTSSDSTTETPDDTTAGDSPSDPKSLDPDDSTPSDLTSADTSSEDSADSGSDATTRDDLVSADTQADRNNTDSESSDTQPSDSADSTSTDSASDPSADPSDSQSDPTTEVSDSSDTSPDPTATPDDTTPDDPTTDPESPSDPSQETDAGDTQPDTTEDPSNRPANENEVEDPTLTSSALENLFAKELPASPEALNDTILNSNYVEEIIREPEAQKVLTDSELIEVLESVPSVLSEITAVEDNNVVFVPTENVNFPAQEFSFVEEKVVSQDLGTLIFVNNKASSWNTYITVSDFTLLSGNAVIPASAVTVDPGSPVLLSSPHEASIAVGENQTLNSENDKSTLVSVSSGTEVTQEVFVLRPRLQIRIPPGTPAGTYLATFTVTTL